MCDKIKKLNSTLSPEDLKIVTEMFAHALLNKKHLGTSKCVNL